MNLKAIAAIIILLIVVAAILLFLLNYVAIKNYVYGLFGISNSIYISGVSLEINNANPVSCFGNVVQPLPAFYTEKGSPFNYTLNLTNACASPHNVTNITSPNPGFSIKVLSPKLQYEISRTTRPHSSCL